MTDPTRHIHAPGDAERRVGELIGPARHLRVESACREASVLADMLAGSDRRIDAKRAHHGPVRDRAKPPGDHRPQKDAA